MHIVPNGSRYRVEANPFFGYKENVARCVSFPLIRMLFLIREYLEAAGRGRIWTQNANHADMDIRKRKTRFSHS